MSQKKIGAKIVIDGEQEFRQALVQSKNAMKEFESEMKLVTSQFKNNEKSMEALKSKQQVYQKQQQELTKQSKLLVEQIQKASKEYEKASKVQEQQAEKIKKLEKALSEAKKEYGDSSEEVQRLEAELSEANEEYAKQERCITNLSTKISKWNTDLNNTQTELIETDRALDETNEAIEHYDDNLEDAEAETKKFGIVMGDASTNTESLRVSLGSLVSAQVVVDVLRNCARAIKDVATAAVDVGMQFEQSMSKVEALSGATGDSLQQLSDKAREMGATTMFSASESAEAFSYMALAGWDVEQMLEGIEPVLSLAAAANMDLAEASDIVTDYLTAFGLKAEDAGHFADAMATAMSTSNTTVELLGDSYKNCAATCASLGIEMEDVTAVLATMANAGVKGSEAGTALSTIMTRLATNTKDCDDKLEAYGVHVYDAQGKMNSLSSILNGMAEVWGTLSQQEQAALAKSVAGVAQYSKFQTIMQGVSEAAKEGGQSFDDYAAALRDCDGAAAAMAKTMQDNLAGDITILKSALEGLGIATEGVFDDAFREAVQGATDAVAQLERSVSDGDLGVSLAELGDAFANLTESLVDSAEEGLPGFIEGLTWLLNNLDTIGSMIKVTAEAFVAYKAASLAATIATEGFTVALNANPVGLVAAALAALTFALYEEATATQELTIEQSKEVKESENLIKSSEELNNKIKDSTKSRKDEIAQLEAQGTAARKLVSELFNETTTQERRGQVLAELKSIYPELNAQLDEHGNIIGATQAQMEKYIDTSLQMAKVEAAKEHLTEIAKEQFEAEQKLAEIEDQVADAVAEVGKAEADRVVDAQKHVDMNGNLVETYTEYDEAAKQAKESLEGLRGQEEETKNTVSELGEEYQRTLDYIDNNAPIDEAASSTEGLADAEGEATQMTAEMREEMDKLAESISKSIEGSLDLTQKWSQDWSTSTEDMTKNVESQIEGIQNWAENFDKLATTSKVAIDDNVMKYLAEMGTEGAGLVQQLADELEKSPEKLQGFSDAMAQYLKLEDSVAAEITDSYVECITQGVEGAATAMSDSSGALTDATTAMTETLVEGMKDAGEQSGKAMAESLEESSNANVKPAAQKVGDDVIKGITDKTGTDGAKVKEIGQKADKALGEGLKQGQAKSAATTVSQEIVDEMANVLSAEAGDEIGSNFMNALGEAIQSYGEQVLENARSIAEEAKSIISEAGSGGSDESGGGGEDGSHADGLAYVPFDNYIARLHEGERVLTKEENRQYSALLGNVSSPSFDAVSSQLSGLGDGRAVVINNDITVDGAQDPEAWTQTFIRTLKREARMA